MMTKKSTVALLFCSLLVLPAFASDVNSMVVVVRNSANHPPVQQPFVDRVKDTLVALPPNVLSFLSANNVRVHVVSTALDEDPNLGNAHPRGYDAGATYSNVPSFFHNGNVVVCNYAMRDNVWGESPDPAGTTRHEIGHAIDRFLGYPSRQDEFHTVYYQDLGRMTDEQKQELPFLVQSGEGGPAECFAESCGTILGGRRNKKHVEAVRASFPNVIRYIQAKLATL